MAYLGRLCRGGLLPFVANQRSCSELTLTDEAGIFVWGVHCAIGHLLRGVPNRVGCRLMPPTCRLSQQHSERGVPEDLQGGSDRTAS